MSDTATPELLIREFPVELTEGDGRTLEGRVVPYGVAARVADPPDFRPYEEMFVRGAFRGAVKAPNRVFLAFGHAMDETNIRNIVGHGVEFEEHDDGLHGRFRILDDQDGEKARLLIREKILGSFSVEFKPLAVPKIVNGVVQRLKVHLDRVALVRQGAYPTAEVLALREAPVDDEQRPEALLLPMIDPDLLNRAGHFVTIPEGLRGHGEFDPQLAEQAAHFVDVPEELGGTATA